MRITFRSIVLVSAVAVAAALPDAALSSDSDTAAMIGAMRQKIHEIHMEKDPARKSDLMQDHMQLMLDLTLQLQKAAGATVAGEPAAPRTTGAVSSLQPRSDVLPMLMMQMLQHIQAMERSPR